MTESYMIRPKAAPLSHKVYTKFLNTLKLGDSEKQDLIKRGLTPEIIKNAGYATKGATNNNLTTMAIGAVSSDFNLEGVAGFYANEKTGHWTCANVQGLAIPIRDIEGNIHSVLIRNAKAKVQDGKTYNKYIAFSSAGKPKGTKVWQITHCPITKGNAREACGSEVRVTEGVLKADIATALGDVYCVGIQGLKLHNDFELIMKELEISTVRICLDAGEDGNTDMIRCKAELIEKVREIGHDVIVETWDPKYGKGIDDVIKAGYADKITVMTEEEIDKTLEKANRKNPMNGDWIYIIATERFINTKTRQELKKSQFADKFGLKSVDVVNDLLANDFPQVDQMTFYPMQEQIVVEKNLTCYNSWIDPKISPEEGDVSPFIQHMEYLIDDKSAREIFLDYLAYQCQHPGKKVLWAPIIQGNEGIGKSYIAYVMKQLLGDENINSPSNEELHEMYTAWQKHTQFVIVEEVMARGRLELMNKLKPIITQDTTQIREMHKTSYSMPNRFNMLMFTNHEDALIIDDKDRRYLVIYSEAKLMEIEYYEKLWEWTKNRSNIAKILNFMMTRDLSNFKPHGKAPDTKAKERLIEISRNPLEEWMSNNIKEGNWPFAGDLVAIRHLKQPKICPSGYEKISDYKWAQALKNVGAVPYSQQIKMSDNSNKVIWILRKKEIYLAQDREYIRKKYEEKEAEAKMDKNPLMESMPM